jgi:hypothetical protein
MRASASCGAAKGSMNDSSSEIDDVLITNLDRLALETFARKLVVWQRVDLQKVHLVLVQGKREIKY